MTTLRTWFRTRRFHALVRELNAMPARELAILGIVPAEISRLAFAASHA